MTSPLGAIRRPRARHPYGLGGIGDFNAIVSADPSAAAAWSQINTQLQAENGAGLVPPGAIGTLTATAQQDFADAYQGLNSAGADVTQIVGAAQQYTVQARSVLGAVQNVSGFIAAAQNPDTPPQALVSSFTGILVGVAIAAGAVSAGVGAAVVGGVALGVQALDSAGFFPASPTGRKLCDGSVRVGQQDGQDVPGAIVIGCCVGQYPDRDHANVPGPQDSRWRSFPTDAWWFTVVQQSGSTLLPLQWQGGLWGSGSNGPRPIDACFPEFRHLECESSMLAQMPGLNDAGRAFSAAFYQAWRLNSTLSFNGQQRADNLIVLKHLVNTWNLAHESNVSADFTFPVTSGYMPSPGPHACSDVVNFGSFVSYLAGSYGAPLTIHGGALKQPPATMALTNNVAGASAANRLVTLAKVGAFVGGSALLASSAYAYATGRSLTSVWDNWYNKIRRTVRL